MHAGKPRSGRSGVSSSSSSSSRWITTALRAATTMHSTISNGWSSNRHITTRTASLMFTHPHSMGPSRMASGAVGHSSPWSTRVSSRPSQAPQGLTGPTRQPIRRISAVLLSSRPGSSRSHWTRARLEAATAESCSLRKQPSLGGVTTTTSALSPLCVHLVPAFGESCAAQRHKPSSFFLV